MTTVAVPLADLTAALIGRFASAGLSADDASALADYFVATEAAGTTTHGLARVGALLDIVAADTGSEPTVETVAPGVARIEAHGTVGLVAVQRATDVLLELTTEHRSGAVALTGYRGNTGALGYFTAAGATRGFVTIAVSNCEAGVAPAGGIDPVLGTNPIAISFPCEPDPITLDIATSALSYGAIQRHRRRGESLPAGAVIAADGSPSLDPADAETGAQLPMAGHKGYGLGLMVELLTGAFIGGKLGRSAVPGDDGTLLVAVAVDRFRTADLVASDVAALVDELHASRPTDPGRPVAVPGERSAERRRAVLRADRLDVDATVWDRLRRDGAR